MFDQQTTLTQLGMEGTRIDWEMNAHKDRRMNASELKSMYER